MTESKDAKLWSLDEISELVGEAQITRERLQQYNFKGEKFADIVKLSTDLEGEWVVRTFKKTGDKWVELNIDKMRDDIAEKLHKHVNAKLLLKDVLSQESPQKLLLLQEKLKVPHKVVPSIQRGSCLHLHVIPAKGKKEVLQVTS